MRTSTVRKVVAGVALAAMTSLAGAQEHRGLESVKREVATAKITLAQAIETAQKEVAGGKVIEAGLEAEKDAAFYEVVVLSGDALKEVKIDAASRKVLGIKEEKPEKDEEKELAESKQALSAAKLTFVQALEKAGKEVKDGKAFKIELEMKGGQATYEVVLLQGDKVMKTALDAASGKVLKTAEWQAKGEKKEQEEEEDEEGENESEEGHGLDTAKQPEHKEASEGGAWRQEFKVDKANWVDHGTNPYFILEPGYRWRYKHGTVVLTITVLAETKVVDGVTTRVVEEREEKDGQPLEVSRNYFAIDKGTGNVYYFGEDVNEYKDGKVVGHEGGWLAGANGAKFGLMMPGQAKVGDKFYQEIAPKTTMDRAEIVSLVEKVETPAGKYEKCLHVKETTPLEKGVSHKWYAPGVGLVKDDEFVLEAVEKPKQ